LFCRAPRTPMTRGSVPGVLRSPAAASGKMWPLSQWPSRAGLRLDADQHVTMWVGVCFTLWRSCGPRTPGRCSPRSTSATIGPSASPSSATRTPRRSSSTPRTLANSGRQSLRRGWSQVSSWVSRAPISQRGWLTAWSASLRPSYRCRHRRASDLGSWASRPALVSSRDLRS
jgi:hypothetical protein